MQAGRTGPLGGVFIEMKHLGPEEVRRRFKGMVTRCADCGFDLAAGRVEVVPTAHYMMGGVVFGADCRTALPRLYVAGEDAGGVHGANRLGGNGVANSTVFGAIAGDVMAAVLDSESTALPEPDREAADAAMAACLRPVALPRGDLGSLRDALQQVMWEDVGILRTGAGLRRAIPALESLTEALDEMGIGDQPRAFNLSWHDWLNLESQLLVSRAIATAALARENSRGAHYRIDHPAPGSLVDSRFTELRLEGERLEVRDRPVAFTLVRPGESLIATEGDAA